MNQRQIVVNKHTLVKVRTIGGYISLLTTWYIIIVMLSAFTEGWLAPWDTQRTRPSLGTWERSVNDFFEGIPGSLLPALTILCISISLYVYGKKKSVDRIKFTEVFALINFIFLLLEAVFVTLIFRFPNIWPLPYPDINSVYGGVVPAVVITFILLLFLIFAQGKISLGQKT